MKSSSKLKTGVLFLSLEKSVNGIITILLIPVIIKSIGIENYGLWGISLGILSYLQYCDLGMSFSLERFVAFHEAKHERSAIQDIITTSFSYLLCFCIVLFVFIAIFGKPIMHVLTRNAGIADTSRLLLYLFPALAANILQSVYMSIPRGFQNFDISSKIQMSGKIVFATSLVGLLFIFKNIQALIISYTLQSFFTLISYIVCVKKIAPYIILTKVGFSVSMLRQLMNFGVKLQVSSIAFLVTMHFDKMLLSSFFGLAFVGYYEAATRIIYTIRDIPLFLMSVLTPRISELVSLNNHDTIRSIYQKVTKQLAIISFFLMTLLLFNSSFILKTLLKSDPPSFTIYVFCLMCICCFWHVISGGASYITRGMGLTSVEMKTNIVTLTLNVTLSIALMQLFGANGVVCGTAAALAFSPFICYYIANQLFELRPGLFLRETFGTPFIYGVIMGTLFIATSRFIGLRPDTIWLAITTTLILVCLTHMYYRLTKDPVYEATIRMVPFIGSHLAPSRYN